jgi:hypothetical protein
VADSAGSDIVISPSAEEQQLICFLSRLGGAAVGEACFVNLAELLLMVMSRAEFLMLTQSLSLESPPN